MTKVYKASVDLDSLKENKLMIRRMLISYKSHPMLVTSSADIQESLIKVVKSINIKIDILNKYIDKVDQDGDYIPF